MDNHGRDRSDGGGRRGDIVYIISLFVHLRTYDAIHDLA